MAHDDAGGHFHLDGYQLFVHRIRVVRNFWFFAFSFSIPILLIHTHAHRHFVKHLQNSYLLLYCFTSDSFTHISNSCAFEHRHLVGGWEKRPLLHFAYKQTFNFNLLKVFSEFHRRWFFLVSNDWIDGLQPVSVNIYYLLSFISRCNSTVGGAPLCFQMISLCHRFIHIVWFTRPFVVKIKDSAFSGNA